MNGSWHRYRPGERWRRPPARARLVLEVPGAVAVCFDAPVVELFEQRAEALHPALAQPRAGPARARLRRRRGASAGCAPRNARDLSIARGAARPAGAGRHRQHLAQRDAVRRAGRPVRAGRRPRRRDAPPDRRDGPAAADGECRDRARARSAPMRVYRRTGRPCPRCGTAIRSDQLRGEIPRTTYWCPRCQGRP